MSNLLYPKFKEAALKGEVDLLTNDVVAVLVDSADYTYAATHTTMADVPAIARVSMTAVLTGKTVVDGVFDAADSVYPSATGDESEVVILATGTGSIETFKLVVYIDTATGLPVIPNTGDINAVWDNGANKIFKL
ncbi:hypothetical protein [Neptunomonas antarctica]|uniref:Uncharacterized protein n=1 Tax=Neptunomonas antarctica TaxID=619304 RepID=A0A1N7MNH3_9GAMM|nr:hypothetical protein [Neptunomonas antarctica]SIS87693.1 hypothetical protein SAMN05421760_106223 [Neptunomonas antarctica]